MTHFVDPARLRQIKAILFDKDGTLIDFNRTWFSIAWQLAQQSAAGNEADARRLLDAGGYDWDKQHFRANSTIAAGTVEDIVSLWHPELQGSELRARIVDYDALCVSEGARSAVAIDGMSATLAALQQLGYRLGIATNDSEQGARATAAALGVDHFFEAMIGYDTAARPKPFADPLLYFARQLGLQPQEVAMVGDNLHDLETAHNAAAGLAIGVLSGNSPYEALAPRADIVLASIADLPALFAAAGASEPKA